MAIKFISAKDFGVKLKGALHFSGRLGFSEPTAEAMKLGKDSSIQFAYDDENDNILYIIHSTIPSEDGFKVTKSGKYYSVNAKPFFDSRGYDYKNNTIIFDMVADKELDENAYKLVKREKRRK